MILATIWFLLWGLLWAIYFITDGYDLGIGSLLPFLGRDESRRRVMLGAVGPLWDGFEVWLLTAGGVTFAAFPKMYAVMFSAFYTPLMLLLFALILRGVSFEFRGQVESPTWRKIWDACIFLGSLVPAVLFGVAFANIFRGIPLDAQGVYQGNLFTLLNPYGLLGGVLFLLFFLTHGAIMLAHRTEGELQKDAARAANRLWYGWLIAAVVCLVASAFSTNLYSIYLAHPALFLVIALAVAALLGVKVFLIKGNYRLAWLSSAVAILGVVFYGVIGLYPNMLPSSLDPSYSVTVSGAASTALTLTIMLVLGLIFLPIVIGYQFWAYRLFAGKVTENTLAAEDTY
ncbi:MAG: cytochrome d ubiquinol oxidase subunit II [Thermodesulfobacteriota bacterium]